MTAVNFSGPLPVLNVRDFGAMIDGTTNDTAAIQRAINAAEALTNGGVVYIPAGVTVINSRLRTSNPTSTDATDGHALVITGSNVHIQGAGRGSTLIKHNAYGGGSFQTNWQVVDTYVFRGSAFFLAGGNVGTEFSDFEITGGYTPTGNNTIPANPSTGDGWDDTFHAIELANDLTFDLTYINRIHAHNYSGEIIQGAGIALGRVFAFDNVLHDTNGDCWSIQAQTQFCRNFLYNAYGNGIDSCQAGFGGKPSLYSDNLIYNCFIGINIAWLAGYTGIGHLAVRDNTIILSSASGIAISGVSDFDICDNDLVDCGYANTLFAFQVQTAVSLPLDSFTISRNTLRYVTKGTSNTAFVLVDTHSAVITGGVITDNIVQLTAAGVTAGKSVTAGFGFTNYDPTCTILRNLSYGTTNAATTNTQVTNYVIAGTVAADVVSVLPVKTNALYELSCSFIVANAPTTVQVVARWRDEVNNRSYTFQASASLATGFYVFPPIVVHAVNISGSVVAINVTAGTANNVSVNLQVREVG